MPRLAAPITHQKPGAVGGAQKHRPLVTALLFLATTLTALGGGPLIGSLSVRQPDPTGARGVVLAGLFALDVKGVNRAAPGLGAFATATSIYDGNATLHGPNLAINGNLNVDTRGGALPIAMTWGGVNQSITVSFPVAFQLSRLMLFNRYELTNPNTLPNDRSSLPSCVVDLFDVNGLWVATWPVAPAGSTPMYAYVLGNGTALGNSTLTVPYYPPLPTGFDSHFDMVQYVTFSSDATSDPVGVVLSEVMVVDGTGTILSLAKPVSVTQTSSPNVASLSVNGWVDVIYPNSVFDGWVSGPIATTATWKVDLGGEYAVTNVYLCSVGTANGVGAYLGTGASLTLTNSAGTVVHSFPSLVNTLTQGYKVPLPTYQNTPLPSVSTTSSYTRTASRTSSGTVTPTVPPTPSITATSSETPPNTDTPSVTPSSSGSTSWSPSNPPTPHSTYSNTRSSTHTPSRTATRTSGVPDVGRVRVRQTSPLWGVALVEVWAYDVNGIDHAHGYPAGGILPSVASSSSVYTGDPSRYGPAFALDGQVDIEAITTGPPDDNGGNNVFPFAMTEAGVGQAINITFGAPFQLARLLLINRVEAPGAPPQPGNVGQGVALGSCVVDLFDSTGLYLRTLVPSYNGISTGYTLGTVSMLLPYEPNYATPGLPDGPVDPGNAILVASAKLTGQPGMELGLSELMLVDNRGLIVSLSATITTTSDNTVTTHDPNYDPIIDHSVGKSVDGWVDYWPPQLGVDAQLSVPNGFLSGVPPTSSEAVEVSLALRGVYNITDAYVFAMSTDATVTFNATLSLFNSVGGVLATYSLTSAYGQRYNLAIPATPTSTPSATGTPSSSGTITPPATSNLTFSNSGTPRPTSPSISRTPHPSYTQTSAPGLSATASSSVSPLPSLAPLFSAVAAAGGVLRTSVSVNSRVLSTRVSPFLVASADAPLNILLREEAGINGVPASARYWHASRSAVAGANSAGGLSSDVVAALNATAPRTSPSTSSSTAPFLRVDSGETLTLVARLHLDMGEKLPLISSLPLNETSVFFGFSAEAGVFLPMSMSLPASVNLVTVAAQRAMEPDNRVLAPIGLALSVSLVNWRFVGVPLGPPLGLKGSNATLANLVHTWTPVSFGTTLVVPPGSLRVGYAYTVAALSVNATCGWALDAGVLASLSTEYGLYAAGVAADPLGVFMPGTPFLPGPIPYTIGSGSRLLARVPPTGGTMSVFPFSGTSLSTPYSLSSSGWLTEWRLQGTPPEFAVFPATSVVNITGYAGAAMLASLPLNPVATAALAASIISEVAWPAGPAFVPFAPAVACVTKVTSVPNVPRLLTLEPEWYYAVRAVTGSALDATSACIVQGAQLSQASKAADSLTSVPPVNVSLSVTYLSDNSGSPSGVNPTPPPLIGAVTQPKGLSLLDNILNATAMQVVYRAPASWPGTPVIFSFTQQNASLGAGPMSGALVAPLDGTVVDLIFTAVQDDGGAVGFAWTTVSVLPQVTSPSDAISVSAAVSINIANAVSVANPYLALQYSTAALLIVSSNSSSDACVSCTGGGSCPMCYNLAQTKLTPDDRLSLLNAVTSSWSAIVSASASSNDIPLDDGSLTVGLQSLALISILPGSASLPLSTRLALVAGVVAGLNSAMPQTARSLESRIPSPTLETQNSYVVPPLSPAAAELAMLALTSNTFSGNASTPALKSTVSPALLSAVAPALSMLGVAMLRGASPGDPPLSVAAGPALAFAGESFCGSAIIVTGARVSTLGESSMPNDLGFTPCLNAASLFIKETPSPSLSGSPTGSPSGTRTSVPTGTRSPNPTYVIRRLGRGGASSRGDHFSIASSRSTQGRRAGDVARGLRDGLPLPTPFVPFSPARALSLNSAITSGSEIAFTSSDDALTITNVTLSPGFAASALANPSLPLGIQALSSINLVVTSWASSPVTISNSFNAISYPGTLIGAPPCAAAPIAIEMSHAVNQGNGSLAAVLSAQLVAGCSDALLDLAPTRLLDTRVTQFNLLTPAGLSLNVVSPPQSPVPTPPPPTISFFMPFLDPLSINPLNGIPAPLSMYPTPGGIPFTVVCPPAIARGDGGYDPVANPAAYLNAAIVGASPVFNEQFVPKPGSLLPVSLVGFGLVTANATVVTNTSGRPAPPPVLIGQTPYGHPFTAGQEERRATANALTALGVYLNSPNSLDIVPTATAYYTLAVDCSTSLAKAAAPAHVTCSFGAYGQSIAGLCPVTYAVPACLAWSPVASGWGQSSCVVTGTTSNGVLCSCTSTSLFGARFAALGDTTEPVYAAALTARDFTLFAVQPYIIALIFSIILLTILAMFLGQVVDTGASRRYFFALSTDEELMFLRRAWEIQGKNFVLDRVLDREAAKVMRRYEKLGTDTLVVPAFEPAALSLTGGNPVVFVEGKRGVLSKEELRIIANADLDKAPAPTRAAAAGLIGILKQPYVSLPAAVMYFRYLERYEPCRLTPDAIKDDLDKMPRDFVHELILSSKRRALLLATANAIQRVRAWDAMLGQTALSTPDYDPNTDPAHLPPVGAPVSSVNERLVAVKSAADQLDHLSMSLCKRSWQLRRILTKVWWTQLFYRHSLWSALTRYDPTSSRVSRLLLLMLTLISGLYIITFFYTYSQGTDQRNLPPPGIMELTVIAAIAAVVQQPINIGFKMLFDRAGVAEFEWRYPFIAAEMLRRRNLESRLNGLSIAELRVPVVEEESSATAQPRAELDENGLPYDEDVLGDEGTGLRRSRAASGANDSGIDHGGSSFEGDEEMGTHGGFARETRRYVQDGGASPKKRRSKTATLAMEALKHGWIDSPGWCVKLCPCLLWAGERWPENKSEWVADRKAQLLSLQTELHGALERRRVDRVEARRGARLALSLGDVQGAATLLVAAGVYFTSEKDPDTGAITLQIHETDDDLDLMAADEEKGDNPVVLPTDGLAKHGLYGGVCLAMFRRVRFEFATFAAALLSRVAGGRRSATLDAIAEEGKSKQQQKHKHKGRQRSRSRSREDKPKKSKKGVPPEVVDPIASLKNIYGDSCATGPAFHPHVVGVTRLSDLYDEACLESELEMELSTSHHPCGASFPSWTQASMVAWGLALAYIVFCVYYVFLWAEYQTRSVTMSLLYAWAGMILLLMFLLEPVVHFILLLWDTVFWPSLAAMFVWIPRYGHLMAGAAAAEITTTHDSLSGHLAAVTLTTAAGYAAGITPDNATIAFGNSADFPAVLSGINEGFRQKKLRREIENQKKKSRRQATMAQSPDEGVVGEDGAVSPIEPTSPTVDAEKNADSLNLVSPELLHELVVRRYLLNVLNAAHVAQIKRVDAENAGKKSKQKEKDKGGKGMASKPKEVGRDAAAPLPSAVEDNPKPVAPALPTVPPQACEAVCGSCRGWDRIQPALERAGRGWRAGCVHPPVNCPRGVEHAGARSQPFPAAADHGGGGPTLKIGGQAPPAACGQRAGSGAAGGKGARAAAGAGCSVAGAIDSAGATLAVGATIGQAIPHPRCARLVPAHRARPVPGPIHGHRDAPGVHGGVVVGGHVHQLVGSVPLVNRPTRPGAQ